MGIFDKPDRNRPRVSLKMRPWEAVVELAALAGIAMNLALYAYYWPKLPDAAMAQGALNRSNMFLIVTLLPLIVYLAATAMGLFPRQFSYPVTITEENAPRQYRLATNMLRCVKAEVALCMLDIEWVYVNIAMGQDMSLSLAFVVVFLGLVVATIFYFVYEMIRQK